jgi:hypothetical protein
MAIRRSRLMVRAREDFFQSGQCQGAQSRVVISPLDTMRKLSRFFIALCCLIGTLAFAQAPVKCNSGPKSAWTASDKLSKLLETKGYKVRRIGDMAGCYVVVGTNEKGEDGEFFFHPLTLGIVGSRLR